MKNLERLQTRIEMIRSESRILSYQIERLEERRKQLSDEKRYLKASLSLEMKEGELREREAGNHI